MLVLLVVSSFTILLTQRNNNENSTKSFLFESSKIIYKVIKLLHAYSKTIYLASLIILLFCFLATIILNLSKSDVLALLVFASIFFAHAVLFQAASVLCSSQALIRFFCVAFLGNLLTTISVSERRFKPIG